MKLYRSADLLTLVRLVLSPFMVIVSDPFDAFLLFSILFFTDYMDGVLATWFPDPHKETRFYNKLPVTFDNLGDISLFVGGLLWIFIYKAYQFSDIVLALVIAVVFVIARILQDGSWVKEPLKTYGATVAMWCFGALIVLETYIMIRTANMLPVLPVMGVILLVVLFLRKGRNVNTADKRN